jgi:hypothetical protein
VLATRKIDFARMIHIPQLWQGGHAGDYSAALAAHSGVMCL